MYCTVVDDDVAGEQVGRGESGSQPTAHRSKDDNRLQCIVAESGALKPLMDRHKLHESQIV
jgi:hypothetical protein